MTDFVQIINTIGFPIACCLAMGYFFKYITDKDRDERQALSERHDNEMKEITAALNNNTLALQKLCERLGAADDED